MAMRERAGGRVRDNLTHDTGLSIMAVCLLRRFVLCDTPNMMRQNTRASIPSADACVS
jgi:hypothetical protein